MKSGRTIGNLKFFARRWVAAAILTTAAGLAHAQTQKPKVKTPVVAKPTAAAKATTTTTAPSSWKSVFHKTGSAPKTSGTTKTIRSKGTPAVKPAVHARTASISKPSKGSKSTPGARAVASSKPGANSNAGIASHTETTSHTATTSRTGTTSRTSTGANRSADSGGLTSASGGAHGTGSGKGAGLMDSGHGATTAGNRGASADERKATEARAPENNAPERATAETKSGEAKGDAAKGPDAKTSENRGAENSAGENRGAAGARTVTRPNGDRAEYNSAGKPTVLTTKSGVEARIDSRGQVRAIHTQGMTVRLGPRGGRTIVTEQPDHTRLVSMGAHYGYVDHPVMRGGQPYLERTYVSGGRVYARAYPGYYFHGRIYYHYLPQYHYAPAFYGWAVHRWHAPVAFAWGWGPWLGYDSYYFTPYPAYTDAALWLTDYIIAQQLQDAYEAQQAANAPAAQSPPDESAPPPISPAEKQAIAAEVTAQLDAEQNAAANPQTIPPPGSDAVPEALVPMQGTFIVDVSLDEQGADGAACTLSPGDVLTRLETSADAEQDVRVLVASSQRGDCAAGTRFGVSVSDLQDMANHMHEKVDDGVGQLAKNQGQNGLPPAPPADPVLIANAQAKPDLDASHQLQQQQHQADDAQKGVQQNVNALGADVSEFFIQGPRAIAIVARSVAVFPSAASNSSDGAAILPLDFDAQIYAPARSSAQSFLP